MKTIKILTILVFVLSFVRIASAQCTNGDCPEDPGCTNGDCPTDPGCTNGDCPEDPGCTNGDCPVPIPDVVGMAQFDAAAAISNAGFTVGFESNWYQCNDIVPRDHVISQSPEAGTQLVPGSMVELTVSSGPCGGPVGPGDTCLIAHWKLDETSGTVAEDSAGTNDGTLYGDPIWQPTDGALDGALQFDGVNDYVDCGNATILDIRDQITLACWIKVASFTRAWQTILAKGDNSYMLCGSSVGDSIHFGITGTSLDGFDGIAVVTDDEWHHIAGVYDGSDAMLYVDGVLDTAIPCMGQINSNTCKLFIGENSQVRGRYLKGLVDDVRIYNQALNDQEIGLVMLGVEPQAGGEITVENFSFELPGTVKIKGWDGVCSDPAWTGLVYDIPGWSSDLAAFDSGVETDSEPTNGLWTAFLMGGDPAVWQLTNHTIASGELFELTVNARITTGAGATLQMVLYYDQAGVRMPVVIEEAVPLTYNMEQYTVSFDAEDVPAAIGKKIGIEFMNVATDPNSFVGLDNIRLEFVSAAGSQPGMGGLVAHWKLDETSGDIVFDSAGLNDGATYGEPLWQPTGGMIDGALQFDGSDDYVSLPIGSLIGSLTDSTLSTWVNWSGTGGDWQRIFDFGSGDQSNMFLTPGNGNTGTLLFAITTGEEGIEDQTTAMAPLLIGWHHVAVTIDSNKKHMLYLDGVLVAQNNASRYTPSSLGNTTQNWLGRSQYPDLYFNGSLDDFRIYDRVLGIDEITQLWADGLVGN